MMSNMIIQTIAICFLASLVRAEDAATGNEAEGKLQQNSVNPSQMMNQMGQQLPNQMGQLPNQMMNQMGQLPNQMMNQLPNQMMNQFPNQMMNQLPGQMNQMMNQMQPFGNNGMMPNGNNMNSAQMSQALSNMLRRGMSMVQAVRQLFGTMRNYGNGQQFMPNGQQMMPNQMMPNGQMMPYGQQPMQNGGLSLNALTGPLDGVLSGAGLPLQLGSLTGPLTGALNNLLPTGGLRM